MKLFNEGNPLPDFNDEELENFFDDHLNHIYCAKAHLIERLQELADHEAFADLQAAIDKTLVEVETQINHIDAIYRALTKEKPNQICNDLIGSVEGAFSSIARPIISTMLRDMSILYYLDCIKSMELTSFKMLLAMSSNFNNNLMQQLLTHSYNETLANCSISQLLLNKYKCYQQWER